LIILLLFIREDEIGTVESIGSFGAFFLLLFFYYYLEDFRYEIYLDSGLEDKSYPFFLDITLFITFLHLVMMINIGIIKKKYF
jgi:hypothetical protein